MTRVRAQLLSCRQARLHCSCLVLCAAPDVTAGWLQDTFRPAATAHERRSYDLYITYDKFYQVPHFWLVGFSQRKTQLKAAQVLP